MDSPGISMEQKTRPNRATKRKQIKAYKSQEDKKFNYGAFGNSKFKNRKCPHEAWFNYGSTKNPIRVCKNCGQKLKIKEK